VSAVDFAAWAEPNLVLTLGGHTFTVRPPSVDDSAKVIALAVRGEVNLGIAEGPMPAELQAIIDTIEPGEHPALGDAYDAMWEAGISPVSIDRMAYYAIFYWARGGAYADWIAAALFTPRQIDESAPEAGESEPPKGS
jgi:hypothetical protein